MKGLIVTTALAAVLAVPMAASAQDAPEPPRIDQSRVARASEVGQRDFVDPGNQYAAAFAKERGISVGQATSLLKRQAALGRFIERLQQRHPDKFAFVSVTGDVIEVGLTDPSIDLQSMLPPGLANVKPVQAVYSEQGTYARLEELKRQLTAAGLGDVTVGVNSRSGRLEFWTKTQGPAVEAAIKSGAIKVDHGYEIVNDEVVVNAGLYGGRSYNVDSCTEYCGGTTGFSLISTTTTARYVSTAGHVANGRAKYNTSPTSTYSSGGASLGSPTELFGIKLDIQYAAPTFPADNYPDPYFWDGTNYVVVQNYTFPTEGVEFCKYGRNTGKTCGIHDTTTILSNAKWNVTYLRRIKNNGSGANFNDEGDSGGPVYYGNWALGWVHGRDSSYNLWYTPFNDFKRLQTAVDLIVVR